MESIKKQSLLPSAVRDVQKRPYCKKVYILKNCVNEPKMVLGHFIGREINTMFNEVPFILELNSDYINKNSL